jgi:hypothetical protein
LLFDSILRLEIITQQYDTKMPSTV